MPADASSARASTTRSSAASAARESITTATDATGAGETPGRICPAHYRYSPHAFAAEAPAALRELDVLYVVGGLYGNELALREVLALFERERGSKRLVFNGDFHWFDVDPDTFRRVQQGTLAHVALRGNVETELAHEIADGAMDAGCGCAYPHWVEDAVVERSNRILRRLRTATTPAQRAELAALPMHARADVGGMRVAIVHGDAESLSGWGFSQEQLRDAAHRARVRQWFDAAKVDAFACSHTCLPVFQSLRARRAPGARWIFNNGAAGMPNFSGDGAGLLTRMATSPCEAPTRRFGVRLGDCFVDAVGIEADAAETRRRFLAQWPPGSDGHASYHERILRGPRYSMEDAVHAEC